MVTYLGNGACYKKSHEILIHCILFHHAQERDYYKIYICVCNLHRRVYYKNQFVPSFPICRSLKN